MRKKILLFVLIGLILPVICLGQVIKIENPLEAETFEELIDSIINFILKIAIVIAPIMIIVSGFYFVTAAGDPEKIKTAKRIILYTMIGLIIVILAEGLISMLGEVLEVK